jgi:hypothetical protein
MCVTFSRSIGGSRFELAIAQRLDLRLRIPAGEGAYPIIAQGDGTDLRTGLVLATPNATVPRLNYRANTVSSTLSNAQELLFRSAVRCRYNPLGSRAEFGR